MVVSQNWVVDSISAGVGGYIKMVENQINGISPINRSDAISKGTRRFKKLCGQTTWFKKVSNKCGLIQPPHPTSGKRKFVNESHDHTSKRVKLNPGPESVLFVPFTPASELKKLVQQSEDIVNNQNRCTKI